MMFWLVVLAVGAVLAALAWWSSGRTKRIAGRPDPQAETDRGQATNQAMIHREGQHGPGAGGM
jgi:Flp pilus assembly protein TadB